MWDRLIGEGGTVDGEGDNEKLQPPELATVEAVPGVDAKPFELNAWTTDDLGAVIDELADKGPFDYRERHFWNFGRTEVQHELVFGHPKLGVRREELRFVLGENIHTPPTVTADGNSFANHVRVLGAGEGRDMVRAEASVLDGRLRRMAVVDDKSVRHAGLAQSRAGQELRRRQAPLTIEHVVVRDTPNAPLGSWEVGDDIRLQGELDWMHIDLWFRVLSITVTPDNPEVISMRLLRSDLA
jgi:hypothetical protein